MEENAFRLVLLSGIPATGKSTYGRWLSGTKGALHLDLENGDLERHGLAQAWSASATSPSESPEPFVRALRRLDRDGALDWGYAPPWLPFVTALHDSGVSAWLFDGDRAAARQAFIRRGTVSVEALDVQMQQIAAVEPALRAFYGVRWLDVMRPDGTYIAWDDLHELMFNRKLG